MRAWEAFCAAVADGADPEELIAAAQHYAETVKRQGTVERYIKLAATFIDQETWRDYVQEPAQLQDPVVQPPQRRQTGRDSPVVLSGSGPYVPGVEETRRRLEALRAQLRGDADGEAVKAAGAGG